MKGQKLDFPALLSLLAFALVWPLEAQDARASGSAKHSLWKIEGQNSMVYLLGSVHLLKKENYPLPSAIEAAFANAQTAVFEVDGDKLHEPATQLKMMRSSSLPEGETLRDHVSSATYAAFSAHVAKAGLPPAMFESFKPFMAMTILEMAELQQLGFDPEYGLDEYFQARVRKEGKELMALETVDFQIELITGFLKQDGEELMKAELKEIDTLKKDFAEIIEAWQAGNASKLEKLLHDSMLDSPIIFKRLVTDRNQRWVPTIEQLAHGNRNAIVIVGAAHLVGKQGVVELLKKKGLKISQL